MLECSSKDLKTIKNILDHVVPGHRVYAFGSRVNGKSTNTSDLDLAVEAAELIPLEKIAILEECFAESDLSFRVDLIDLTRALENIKNSILKMNYIIIND